MPKKGLTLEEILFEKIHPEHIDREYALLRVDSFTQPETDYMVTAWWDTGLLSCTCNDAVYRSKIMDFMDGTGIPCKHMKAVERWMAIMAPAIKAWRGSK